MLAQNTQLNFLKALAEHRTEFLNSFFLLLDQFDRETFLLLTIPLIWHLYNRKFGVKLFFVMVLSAFCNHALKMCIQESRPFKIEPSIALIERLGYSFPSGAAQGSTVFLGLIAWEFKKVWIYVFAGIWVGLMGFSRLYLGVHYPLDVIAGWIIGAALLTLYLYLYPSFCSFFSRVSKGYAILLALFSPILMALVMPHWLTYILIGFIQGCALILILRRETYFTISPKLLQRVIYFLASLLGLFLAYFFVIHKYSIHPNRIEIVQLYLLHFLCGCFLVCVDLIWPSSNKNKSN